MAQVKGVLLNAWIQFLKSRFGDEKVVSTIQSLEPAQQRQASTRFLDSSWYEFELQGSLGALTRALATPSDRNISFELGRFMADYAFDRVYKGLVARESNRLVRNAWLEDALFQGVRSMKSEMIAESTCLIRYYYEPSVKPVSGMCSSTIGFCVRQAELAGNDNVNVIHPQFKCAVHGNDCCEIIIKW